MSELIERYPISRDQYHLLGEVGFFGEKDRVELLNGELILMSPIGLRHTKAMRRLGRIFNQRLGDLCMVDYQDPVILSETSEPQPDLLLLRPDIDESDELPLPQDVLLVVEIADSSLGYDRGVKLQAYAAAGMREVWILNLREDILESYRAPAGGSFTEKRLCHPGEKISVQALPGVEFGIEELLPKA